MKAEFEQLVPAKSLTKIWDYVKYVKCKCDPKLLVLTPPIRNPYCPRHNLMTLLKRRRIPRPHMYKRSDVRIGDI